ncbi:MAG TPA: J domain-containing protein [Candidatus Eisenbacteria bacterium]|nr:J domain-containing protein [Candidatus Eisenbacteria bacterium]
MVRFEAGSRRAALEGIARILDAGGLEELFDGPDDEALFLYHLLHEVARGRSSPYYWEICRTGRRRSVTPEYVVDRATVLLASIEERRRTDIYRILGVPPLASEEALRQRWIEVAKQAHPDVGGDPAHFRQAKEAYEILRDPARRAEYERFWLRAVGPIARLTDGDDGVPPAPVSSGIAMRQPERRVVMVAKRTAAPEPSPSESVRDLQEATTRFAEAREHLDQHLAAAGLEGLGATRELLAKVDQLLAPVSHADIVGARAEVEQGIARLEALRTELATLADLKRRVVPLT